MRVVYLLAGAGNMYCGSCLHGNTLVAALRRAGEEALLVPAYTPVRTDEENVSIDRIVFGGINVYLQQRWGLFRRTPWRFDRLLDAKGLLGWLGRQGFSTQPESLGPLCVSVLRGEAGRQHKELEKLVHWLKRDVHPELVHLSNVLLAGMARQIGQELGVPVVCTLSGEDVFLEQLPEPHYAQARQELRRRAGDLAALIALNHYYADFMAEYLAVDRRRIHVIRPGLNLVGHGTRPRPSEMLANPAGPRTVRVGYLARVCPDKGLHLLAEALELLARREDLPRVHVHAAGYLSRSDRPYLTRIERRLRRQGLLDRFCYVGELTRQQKIAFLQSLDIMSLPTVYRESKAISVLEAWANGVPVVVPAHGAFPELVQHTGGGLLCAPNDASALAEALAELMRDPERVAACGWRAQQTIHQHYTAERMAQETAALYRAILGQKGSVSQRA